MDTSASAFTCHICDEESATLCLNCTRDTCPNHLCPKCDRCSDCCQCTVLAEG